MTTEGKFLRNDTPDEEMSPSMCSISPSMCSISFEQFMDFNDDASKKFGKKYAQMTMHDITKHVIVPVCQETKRPYALHLNKNGLMVDAFITHCWDEPFREFAKSIGEVFETTMQKPNLWICAFALLQGDEETVETQVGQKNAPLTDAPFVKALMDASKFVVVRNSVKDLYSRIWCVCELYYARKYGLMPANTHVTGPDDFSQLRTSCVDAEASKPQDKERILEVLLNEQDLQEIGDWVQQLRTEKTPSGLSRYSRKGKRKRLLLIVIAIGIAALVVCVALGAGVALGVVTESPADVTAAPSFSLSPTAAPSVVPGSVAPSVVNTTAGSNSL